MTADEPVRGHQARTIARRPAAVLTADLDAGIDGARPAVSSTPSYSYAAVAWATTTARR